MLYESNVLRYVWRYALDPMWDSYNSLIVYPLRTLMLYQELVRPLLEELKG